jgi:hypothetical protein
MKAKWLKAIITLVTLMFCMSVIYFPVLADELDDLIEAPTDEDAQITNDEILATIEQFIDIMTGEAIEIMIDPDGTPIVISETTTDGTGFMSRPFTPPGQGTVVDNATDSDGKEFFIIATVEGDIFYLIIDRQRNVQNVYFLNAVTEVDLIALAREHEREIPAGMITIPTTMFPVNDDDLTENEPEPDEPQEQSDNTILIVILGIVFLGVGGAAYYFKIVKGKKNAPADDYDDDFDDDYENGENDHDYDFDAEESDSDPVSDD